MSVTGLVTAGYLDDPVSVTITLETRDPLVGTLDDVAAVVGALTAPQPLVGTVLQPSPLTGTLSPPAPLSGSLVPPPPIVGRLDCGGEIVTDLSFPKCRSARIPLNLFESDGTTPLDTTGGVIKWWVNDAPEDGLENSEIAKRSYDPLEIETVDASLGQYVLIVRAEDNDLPVDSYVHCVEVTLQGTLATSAGTITVTPGSGVLVGSGLATSSIHKGDVLVPAGSTSANQKPITVDLERDSDGNPTGNLTTDYDAWDTGETISFAIYAADKPEVSGVTGAYSIVAC